MYFLIILLLNKILNIKTFNGEFIMTPEQEKLLLDQLEAMKAKLDSYDKDKTDKANVITTDLRKEMASLTGEKLDSFSSWNDKELNTSIAVLKKKRVTATNTEKPTEDQLVPKLDSKGKEIPWVMRVNWSNASYPEWQ